MRRDTDIAREGGSLRRRGYSPGVYESGITKPIPGGFSPGRGYGPGRDALRRRGRFCGVRLGVGFFTVFAEKRP